MDALQKTLYLLATYDSLDLNTAGLTTLYTCPIGMECFITKVVMRKVDIATLTAVKLSFGWDALAVDVVALTGALTTDTDEYMVFTIIAETAVRGAASETFKVDVQTAEGEAATCSIDVFGYLVPA